MWLKNHWMILVALSVSLLPCNNLFALTKVTVGSTILSGPAFAFTTPNNGINWAFSNVPSVDIASLLGVSCAGSNCVSVGAGSLSSAPFNMPVVYTSDDNGDSWDPSFFVSPLPPGTAVLYSVDCQLTGFCATVGSLSGALVPSPLGYRTNNFGRRKSWTLFFFPTPAPFPGGILRGISCKGNNCAAVGNSQTSPVPIFTFVPLAYATNNSGETWTLSPSPPLPVGETNGSLNAVNCFNSPNCVAVGTAGASLPLAYASNNNGNTWVLSNPLPLPPGATGVQLFGVTCTSINCIAVGVTLDPALLPVTPVAYRSIDNGNNWTLTSAFLFPFPPTTTGLLNGVACDEAECIAVGNTFDSLNNLQEPLAYRSNDTGLTWILSSPSLAGTVFTGGNLTAIAVAG